MAFGNASIPTRKYVYGARDTLPGRTDDAGRRVPFPNHDAAVRQLRAAHALQNEIVEIERCRRAGANRIVHEFRPELAALLVAAEAATVALDAARAAVRAAKVPARSRRADPALAAAARAAAAVSSAAWANHKGCKDATCADPGVRAALDANDAAADAAKSAARTEAVAGAPARPATADRPARAALDPLYWATSLVVMQRVKKSGPAPKFKRWEGEGLIAVQFQRKPDRSSPKVPVLDGKGAPRVHPRSGLPAMRHESGGSLSTDSIHLRNTLCWVERQTNHPKYATVHFRVGSAPDGAPVWADLPAVVHRPLPPAAEVKWAYLSRRKIGTRYKWEVHFDVAASDAAWQLHDATVDARRHPDRSPLGAGRAPSGTVAVALGWRRIDGAVRVAVWKGGDGAGGEITIPAERVDRWTHSDHLQSVRDTRFEEGKQFLREWLRTRVLPDDWKRETRNLVHWRSPNALARLVRWWRDHRLPGDGAAFTRMEGERVETRDAVGAPTGRFRYTGGRRQDKHLCDWRANARLALRDWRKSFYRRAALELASRYREVVVAEIDWHAIAENPAPEECDAAVNKTFRAAAACATLRDELTACMTEVRVAAPGITVTCHRCGARCDPPGAGRWVRCERCGGERMDRGVNAANNLLNRALGAVAADDPARGV